jgi:hypothetical protein
MEKPRSVRPEGGGKTFDTTGVSGGDIAKVSIVQSYPSSSNAWTVWVANKASVAVSGTFYAVCANSN